MLRIFCFLSTFLFISEKLLATENSPGLLYAAVIHKTSVYDAPRNLRYFFEYWRDPKRKYLIIPTSLSKTVKQNREYWLRTFGQNTGFLHEIPLKKDQNAVLIRKKFNHYVMVTNPGYPLSTLLELIRVLEKETLFSPPGSPEFGKKASKVFQTYNTADGSKIERIKAELALTRGVLLENLDLAVENLYKLRNLGGKTDILKRRARYFRDRSKKLNCCGFCTVM